MKTLVSACLVLAIALVQAGCAIPRAVGTDIMMRCEVPIPKHGQRVKLEVHTSVQATEPGGETEIDSPMSVEDTQKWYETQLEARGWKFYTDHICENGTKGKDFRRSAELNVGGKIVALDWWSYQSASLEVRHQGNGSRATISISGNYLWDVPSRLPYLPFYWTLGESKQSMFFAGLLSWL